MFSGIVSSLSIVKNVVASGSGIRLTLSNPNTHSFHVDQSLSHNGVCLTVVSVQDDKYEVDVIAETLSKTTLGSLQEGSVLNIESSVTPMTLLDGHIVQGHVDTTLECLAVTDRDGSWQFTFRLPQSYSHLIILHGSICLNGVSLTVAQLMEDSFQVSIIPYTFSHTNFNQIKPGMLVNAEFDILGKYLARRWSLNG